MTSERCPNCYGRLYGSSQFVHDLTCVARRPVVAEKREPKPPREPRAPKATPPRPRPSDRGRRLAPEHGTRSRYNSSKYRCRCEPCTRAATLYLTEQRSQDPEKRARATQWMRDYRARQKTEAGK